jgi:hypothetical protein
MKPEIGNHEYATRHQKDGIYVLEEQVLVTENGSKVLSQAPWELQA